MKDNEILYTSAMPNLDCFLRLFKSRTRRKVEIEILKLKLQLSEMNKEIYKAHEISKQIDLILRKKSTEKDIELYRKLL